MQLSNVFMLTRTYDIISVVVIVSTRILGGFFMGILVDFQIKEYCETLELVTPFDPALINPASIDVRVGNTAKMEIDNGWDSDRPNKVPEWANIDLTKYSKEKPFWLPPKAFILVATLETFNMPKFLGCEFKLKSSPARNGVDHASAAWCDPGWNGSVLTMEIINNFRYTSIPLYPRQRIGQMIFYRTEHTPEKTYQETGRYNGDKTVMGSKG